MRKVCAIILETAEKSLAPTESQIVMHKLHYSMPIHGFQEMLIVWMYQDLTIIMFQIYFSPSEFPITSLAHM